MSLSTTFLKTVERRMAWMPYKEKIQTVYFFWVKFYFRKSRSERGLGPVLCRHCPSRQSCCCMSWLLCCCCCCCSWGDVQHSAGLKISSNILNSKKINYQKQYEVGPLFQLKRAAKKVFVTCWAPADLMSISCISMIHLKRRKCSFFFFFLIG
jgi:hypothetical protein